MARRNRYTSTIVLAVLVLLASATALWSARRVPDSVREERQTKLLPSLRREQITRVTFEGPTEHFELNKDNNHWFVTSAGRRFPADDTEIERVLTEAEFAAPSRRLGTLDGASRERFGLGNPRERITLRENARVSQSFAIGGLVADEPTVYVEVEHSGFVVSKTVADAFVRTASDLRDRTLSDIDIARITSLEIHAADGGRRVLNQAQSIWTMSVPPEGRVSRAKIDAMLHDLRDMRATRYLADDPDAAALAHYGLSQPRLSVRIARTNGAAIEWHFGGACESYNDEVTVARADGHTVACVGHAVFESINQSADELRDGKLLWAHSDEVERVRVHSASGEFSVVRDHDHWRMEGNAGEIDSESVDAWLTSLGTLSIESRLDASTAAAHGLANPARWLEFTRTGVDGSERLDIGDPDADHLYVQRHGENAVLAVDPTATDNLRIDAARFRSRHLIRDVADQMVGLITEGTTVRDQATQTDGVWRVTQPTNAFADPTVIRACAQRMASLDADRWVSSDVQPVHGLASPRLRVTARFEGTGSEGDEADAGDGGRPRVREYVISIGSEAPGGGFFASLGGKPGVFVLPQAAYDELAQAHVQRDLMEIERSTVERVEIDRPRAGGGTEHIALRRDGEVWRTDAGAPADRTRVGALLDRLALVRAPRVFGYGAPGAEAHLGSIAVAVTTRAASGDAGVQRVRVVLGAPFGEGDEAGQYARVDGLDATLSVPRAFAEAITAFQP